MYMKYIFLDESGDLGFSKASSSWFLFTIAIVSDPRSLERVVKKVWKSLRTKHKHLGELHAYHADEGTRLRILRGLAGITDLKIMTIILNKKKVYADLQNQKNYLYNFTANMLLDRLYAQHAQLVSQSVHLYVDKKDTKKSLQENFVQYLQASVGNRAKSPLHIELHRSHENKSLQAIDFVSWAIFRKYERGDDTYYNLIKDKIGDERKLFG